MIFSDEFEKLLKQKKVAEQNARAQEVKNQQNLKNAENNLKVKELEAKANSVLTESLTDNVLRKMYIENGTENFRNIKEMELRLLI